MSIANPPLPGPDIERPATKTQFLADVLHGLGQPEKELPCKYFYDEAGSRLFERICELEEYYLTRTELAIMRQHVDEMAAVIGPDCSIIEYGCGAGLKIRLLLDRVTTPAAYIPIDISSECLHRCAAEIAARYAGLEVRPLCADFTGDYRLPEIRIPEARRVVYFPGSTIGNFGPPEAAKLLSRVAAVCGPGGGLLLGFDLQKNVSILEAAYDDSKGVTRDFNLNLLARINLELGANFQIDAFRHRATYNRVLNCIEMYLVSLRTQTVAIGNQTISFAENEMIRTERSYKYDIDQFSRWVVTTGLQVQKVWTDERGFFAVLYLTGVRVKNAG
jgi:L-histidine Nalpha-methyltransferase